MPPKQAIRLTNSALYDGTQNVGLVAVPLDARLVITEVIVQADSGNQGTVLVGNADSQSFQLAAGSAVVITIDETSKVWVRGTADWQRVNWLAVGR